MWRILRPVALGAVLCSAAMLSARGQDPKTQIKGGIDAGPAQDARGAVVLRRAGESTCPQLQNSNEFRQARPRSL
jgi:hypothetical protein